jgi:hypothetical protein
MLLYLTLAVAGWELFFKLHGFADFSGWAEVHYLSFCIWLLALITCYGLDRQELREISSRLGKNRYTGPLITTTFFIVIGLCAELGVRYFVTRSDSYGFTLMNEKWVETYWHPTNSLGYRDYEPAVDLDDTVQRVLVVGDSFVAGAGVERVDDTFPHILGQLLGNDYTVNIVAQPGWESPQQYEALNQYPVAPDIVILSHYINDIDWIAEREYPEVYEALLPPQPPAALRWLVDNFFLPNYVYWNILSKNVIDPWAVGNPYLDLAIANYNDPEIWAEQEAVLSRFVDWAQAHRVHLIVVVWPLLTAIDQSEPMVAPVERFFEAEGINVLNMAEVLIGKDQAEIVVNPFDGHPNVYAHSLAAEQLFGLLAARVS